MCLQLTYGFRVEGMKKNTEQFHEKVRMQVWKQSRFGDKTICWASQAYFNHDFMCKKRNQAYFTGTPNYVWEKRYTHCVNKTWVWIQFVHNIARYKVKKKLSDHALLILTRVLYLKSITKLTFWNGPKMFEKSDAHIVTTLLTRFLMISWILADTIFSMY